MNRWYFVERKPQNNCLFIYSNNSIAFNSAVIGISTVLHEPSLYTCISFHIIIFVSSSDRIVTLTFIVLLQVALRYKTIQAEFSLNIVVTGFIIVDVSIYID